jgi:hypothetical protein
MSPDQAVNFGLEVEAADPADMPAGAAALAGADTQVCEQGFAGGLALRKGTPFEVESESLAARGLALGQIPGDIGNATFRMIEFHARVLDRAAHGMLIVDMRSTRCGFPAPASPMKRERSVEDVESQRRCGDLVTL